MPTRKQLPETAETVELTPGEQVDALAKLHARWAKEVKVAATTEKEVKFAEEVLKKMLDEMKLPAMTSKLGEIEIKESIVPTAKDWDAFYKYLFRHKATHLLERRIAVKAYREELEARNGVPIPGVEPFTRRVLKFTPTKGA